MGFCEMVYHETRSFPEAEKQGLARELRSSSLDLLRKITIESVKSQKDFLKALDDTTELQIQILLLLKLAFRMNYIKQQVYQTMEEDLKGLENIVNEMKHMHGLPPSAVSIFEQIESVEKSESKEKTQPKTPAPPPKSWKKSKNDKSSRSKSGRSHRSRAGKGKSAKSSSSTQSKQSKTETEKTQDSPVKSSKKDDFEGTPLYDDVQDKEQTSSQNPKDAAGDKESDSNADNPDNKDQDDKSTKQKPASGRFSLKSSFSRKHFAKSRPKKKRDDKK